jgi:hypothetical protein
MQTTYSEKKNISQETEKQIIDDLIINNLSRKSLRRKYNISTYHIQRIRRENNITTRNSRHETSQKLLFEKGLRKCSSCKEIKQFDEFSLKGDTRPIRGIYSYRCKKCSAEKSLKSYHKHYSTIENILSLRLTAAKKRSKDVSITNEDLKTQFQKQNGKCFYTGTVLTTIVNKPDTLSLDRVDSSKGYHKDNVVLCTSRINRMKREMSVCDFVDCCMSVVDHFFR